MKNFFPFGSEKVFASPTLREQATRDTQMLIKPHESKTQKKSGFMSSLIKSQYQIDFVSITC